MAPAYPVERACGTELGRPGGGKRTATAADAPPPGVPFDSGILEVSGLPEVRLDLLQNCRVLGMRGAGP
ncbi:hypothetical protein NDU88_001186 [Pleurodeles waltl]|uniref:Uncharacterized protein n=1 Tax=Pleurodeles waltl TaxID=8319 RepID=A0AAV7Q598_PLEWA|nr:hypothetical protein NDU88_001186 [Pleurodeles waltl]